MPRLLEPTFHSVRSADSTRLRAWSNGVTDPDLPTVLLCNGLGTNPWAWPGLLRPDCGVRVISWNHRGVGGSDRPADPDRVGVDAFVEDALAVLDDAGIARCPVIGWSIGVNTMFELAVTHPERVSGLFSLAGVPGDTFASMLAPLRVPARLRKPVAVTLTRAVRRIGRPVSRVTTALPVGPLTGTLLTHSGFMLPTPDLANTRRAVKEFLTTPVDWYTHLALAAAEHPRVSLSRVSVPTAFVAGKWDLLADTEQQRTAAARIATATYQELNGTHFVGMEQPDRVHAELLDWLTRVEPTGLAG